MLPFVKVDDRAHMEPLALESAAETARVAADVIHTLLALTAAGPAAAGASIDADISAPALDGLPNLPAKLVLMGTDISTLSEHALPSFDAYHGAFRLRDLPAGTYRMAIERVGSQTLYPPPMVLKAGQTVRANWTLQPPRVVGNMAPNPDLTLHWLTPDAPDHWRFDTPQNQWVSDNIPATAGRTYLAGYESSGPTPVDVEVQWMAHAWEALKGAPIPIVAADPERREISLIAPADAIFVRLVVKGRREPSALLSGVYIKPQRP